LVSQDCDCASWIFIRSLKNRQLTEIENACRLLGSGRILKECIIISAAIAAPKDE
jgi:hypothetical protein